MLFECEESATVRPAWCATVLMMHEIRGPDFEGVSLGPRSVVSTTMLSNQGRIWI